MLKNGTTHEGFPAFMREKGKKAWLSHSASMMKARAAGIRIAYGTDFSNSKNTPYLANGMEFRAIVNAGFTPMESIKIGTINGASDLFVEVFGDKGRHARSAVGTNALPMGIPVEVEMIVRVRADT